MVVSRWLISFRASGIWSGALWSQGLGGGDGEECGCEHSQGDPAVSGGPAADLVLVQAGELLVGLAHSLGAKRAAAR